MSYINYTVWIWGHIWSSKKIKWSKGSQTAYSSACLYCAEAGLETGGLGNTARRTREEERRTVSLVLRTQKQTTPKASESVTQSCHPTQQLMFDMLVALVLTHFRLTTLLSLGEGLFCVHLKTSSRFYTKGQPRSYSQKRDEKQTKAVWRLLTSVLWQE